MKIISILIIFATVSLTLGQEDNCWKNAHGRGAGKPLTECRADQEKSGLICYPKCRDGFHGVGSVCWQDCPPGFPNGGVDCYKPAAYSRGAGYVLWDKKKCERENNQGCEKRGLIYYPKCRSGYHDVVNFCSPSCVNGMTDTGIACLRKTYVRGGESSMTCASGLHQDGLLCYPSCPNNYKGIGPICWQECSPTIHKFDCAAMCTPDEQECIKETAKMVKQTFSLAAVFAQAYATGVIDVPKIIQSLGSTALAFAKGICPK